jgi:Caudovirales tail fibre assembly protein, lambda gpK
MARFAIIEQATGCVVNVVEWSGDTETWQPPLGCNAVQSDAADVGDTLDETSGDFIRAPQPTPTPPTTADVLAGRDNLLAGAALRMAPLQDAVDLGDASAAEEAALKAWKQYRVALSRIEQQSGFPGSVAWPKAPT